MGHFSSPFWVNRNQSQNQISAISHQHYRTVPSFDLSSFFTSVERWEGGCSQLIVAVDILVIFPLGLPSDEKWPLRTVSAGFLQLPMKESQHQQFFFVRQHLGEDQSVRMKFLQYFVLNTVTKVHILVTQTAGRCSISSSRFCSIFGE